MTWLYESVRYIVILVSVVVLLFDHCLTFSSEVEYIWKAKKTPFSCLFLLNRYFALLAMIAYTAFYIILPKQCELLAFNIDAISLYRQVSFNGGATPLLFSFTLVTSLIAEAAIALRAYAVHRNSKLVLLTLSAVWIAHFVLSVHIYVGLKGSVHIPTPHIQARGLIGSELSGVLLVAPAVVFDIIAVGFLTLGLYRQLGVQMPLTRLIIRDGLLYFVVVCLSNIAWVVVHLFYRHNITYNTSFLFFTPIEIWSGCITTTMISRLTLNLRMYDPTAHHELTFETMSLRFRQTQQPTTTDDETGQAGRSRAAVVSGR